MKYKFIGSDGSLGYRYNEVYDLTITEQGNYVLITSPSFYPYSSWKRFYENWQRVVDRPA